MRLSTPIRLYDCSLDLRPLQLDCECVKSLCLRSLRFASLEIFCTPCYVLRIEASKLRRNLSAAPYRLLIIACLTLCESTSVQTSAACHHSPSVAKTSGGTIAAAPWRGYFRSTYEIVEEPRQLVFQPSQPPPLSSLVFPSYYIPHTEKQLTADHG